MCAKSTQYSIQCEDCYNFQHISSAITVHFLPTFIQLRLNFTFTILTSHLHRFHLFSHFPSPWIRVYSHIPHPHLSWYAGIWTMIVPRPVIPHSVVFHSILFLASCIQFNSKPCVYMVFSRIIFHQRSLSRTLFHTGYFDSFYVFCLSRLCSFQLFFCLFT